jgi:hypothetical protein
LNAPTADEPTGPLAVADIVDVLEALCTCEGEDPRCTYCDARQEIEAGRRTATLAQAELTRLRAEVKRLDALAYVPGLWRCAKCTCSLVSTNLHVPSGGFSANTEPQSCPNDCGPMWRVTERDAGNEAIDRLQKLQERLALKQ